MVVTFYKVSSQGNINGIARFIQENYLESICLLVKCGVNIGTLNKLCDTCKVLFYKDDDTFRTLLDFAINFQALQAPNENSWVLDEETSNERFLVCLGLSSLVAQFMLATLSLGQILTLEPSSICRRVGAPSLINLKFFRTSRCTFEWVPSVRLPQTPRRVAAYQPVSPVKASPTKKVGIFYELPRGEVLGQTRLRVCGKGEFSAGKTCTELMTPEPKIPKLITASSPIKCRETQHRNYSKEEICDAIFSLYGNNEEEDNDTKKAGSSFYRVRSPKKQSVQAFTIKGNRLTMPKFMPMRRFPKLPAKK